MPMCLFQPETPTSQGAILQAPIPAAATVEAHVKKGVPWDAAPPQWTLAVLDSQCSSHKPSKNMQLEETSSFLTPLLYCTGTYSIFQRSVFISGFPTRKTKVLADFISSIKPTTWLTVQLTSEQIWWRTEDTEMITPKGKQCLFLLLFLQDLIIKDKQCIPLWQ